MQRPESLWKKEGSGETGAANFIDPEKAKRHRRALAWFLSGWIALVVALPLYAVARFVASSMVASVPASSDGLYQATAATTIFQIINICLSLIPIILIPLGSIIGLWYLLKK